ncbi:putative RING finger and transmembrane domain-containing protein 2 [Cocos nucifera]|uniref:Putative RING finger and transmembrane domain-containing protein 2 n=1 Tax=Cocos nucifera TaxID=13894 RepID=A0A8K0IYQ6_COCNU|nr:putative RING finger and transmembrane domain-containing protein 2 [Cocos nucifera]
MMESGGNSDSYRSQSAGSGGSSRRYGVHFSTSNFIQAPLSALLEYSGILRPRLSHQENDSLISGAAGSGLRDHVSGRLDDSPVAGVGGDGEVSIRIIGVGDQENLRGGSGQPQALDVRSGREGSSSGNGLAAGTIPAISERQGGDGGCDGGVGEVASSSSSSVPSSISAVGPQSTEGEANATGGNNRDSSYQRYDIQQVAKWIEQILPFSLLLLVVFIRQHLQGFFVTIWIAAVMFKSNDILRKQTALK